MAPLARQVGQTTEMMDRLVQKHEAETGAKAALAEEGWDENAI
jgi:hypothetical protein